MFKQMLKRGAAFLCLAAALALPVYAQETRVQEVTPQTTVQEYHDNPTLKAAGFWTYTRDKSAKDQEKWKDKTLSEYMGENVVDDCVAAVNQLMHNYVNGIQVTYKVYSDDEIAADASKDKTELYYYPADASYGKTKYAVVLCGNIYTQTEEVKEGAAVAYQLNQKGYTAFVLRYRTWRDMKDNAPAEDLGNAIRYITSHADQFNVDTEDYAVIGFSSGGHLAGLFGGDKLSYKTFGVPKPGALILAYAVNYFLEGVPVYHTVIDDMALGRRYYDYSITGAVNDNYPPVYRFYGRDDLVYKLMVMELQGPSLTRALQRHNIPYEEEVFDNAPHGCGLGNGTDAAGWLDRAVDFWQQQTA